MAGLPNTRMISSSIVWTPARLVGKRPIYLRQEESRLPPWFLILCLAM
ncbi:hypothetical protein LINPERHAP2_LOCUS33200 [Linum perenne]